MKIQDLLQEDYQQLDEISFKQAVAAGIIGGAMMSPIKSNANNLHNKQQVSHTATQKAVKPNKFKITANDISKKYNIDVELAEEIVKLAHKYQKPNFPTAKDILALIGVESSFNPSAISGLKKDPAIGLLQVRPGVWGINPEDISDSVENQIRIGSAVLHKYYTHLKDKDSAIQAYNIGMTNFQKGHESPQYLGKYQQEVKRYTAI